jgi:hypothetical protein
VKVTRVIAVVALIAIASSCEGAAPRTAVGTPESVPNPDPALPVLPRSSPEFRAAGVHYWQGNWNYNFWSNLKPARLDADFRRIRELNFNTVIVSVPWGLFQVEAFPPRYSDTSFQKLRSFLTKAAEHDLQVALRVATPEHIPVGIEGSNYEVPYLFVDDREFGAYCDLFRETARRLDGFGNLWFLFSSWEDMYGYASMGAADHAQRMRYMRRAVSYAAHLRTRSLSEWNARWRTNYASLEEVPFPIFGTLAYRDFLVWADDRLLQVILPGIARCVKEGSARVLVSHEVRIDSDPIWPNGRDREIEWFDHTRTWNLTPAHDVISVYFNPYWLAPNKNDFIPAGRAVANLERLLRLLQQHTDGRPIFFDQFNFTDATPAYKMNSRLKGEDEIARFLEAGLRRLHEHSVGYAIWAFDAYEGNVLFNSSFEVGLASWTSELGEGGEEVRSSFDEQRQEQFVTLPPGASLRQTVHAPWNPGVADPRQPLTLRLATRSNRGGRLTATVEVPRGTGWRTVHEKRIEPSGNAWTELETELDHTVALRLTLRSTGSVPVAVDEVTLFNHVQDAAVYGPRGETLGRRAEVMGRINAAWARGIARGPSRFTASLDSVELRRFPRVHDDGWIETEATVPLYIASVGNSLRLDVRFPKSLDAAGNSLELLLGNRSLGVHPVRAGGTTTLRIPLQGILSAPGDYWLTVRPQKTFPAADSKPSSKDQRRLGVVLLHVEIEPPGADEATR